MKEFAPRRGTAPAAYVPELPHHAPNAALLIDFDNVTMGIRSDLQQQLKNLLGSEVFKGKISVQRAYADWRRYPQYIVPLSEASIDLIFAPAFGSNKKNATDIRLAIDALELVFTRPEIGTFVLLSGDSDFSSLVLKLKEYGKYVIGIGIRESSSDLLIQNCDEYYAYSELTGLLKESEVEYRRRDPWELVVEALLKMDQRDDVMRSDRLKQVMQEIDPDFDEKDAGYNRYAKFLQEAQRRGLIELKKMDNGQYEIGLGPNANTPMSDAGDAPMAAPSRSRERVPAKERESKPEREPRADREAPRGRGRGRDREARPTSGMSLADAFELMRRALTDLGAVGDESTDATQARERMIQLAGDGDDPVFEEKRFQRLLRQAHDAGVIDLVKSGDDVYLLKLRPQETQPADEDQQGDRREERRDDSDRPRGRRGGRGRGGRGRGEGRRSETRDEPREPVREQPAAREQTAEPAASARRNPRFRRGGRGAPAGASPDADQAPPGPVGAERPAAELRPAPPPPANESRRSLRGRPGRRGVERGPGEAQSQPGFVPGPVDEPAGSPRSVALGGGDERRTSPDRSQRPRQSEPSESTAHPPARRDDPRPDGEDGGGLFGRMTAAFKRAVSGDKSADE